MQQQQTADDGHQEEDDPEYYKTGKRAVVTRQAVENNGRQRECRRVDSREADRPILIGLQLNAVDIHHNRQQARNHHHQCDRAEAEQRCLVEREGVVEQREADKQSQRGK